MENTELKKILDTYKNKSNKDLSNVMMTLHNDFTQIKNHMLELTGVIDEISTVYEKVYTELQSRLKFADKKIENAD